VSLHEATLLVAEVPSHIFAVAVVNSISAAEAGRLAHETGMRVFQLHGEYQREDLAEFADESFELWRANSLGPAADLRTGAFGETMLLIDSPAAGSGERWDISKLDENRSEGSRLLAGGLSPANVPRPLNVRGRGAWTCSAVSSRAQASRITG
jgi:phosphoribosylanthranilate isomerase